ncbi:MAG: 2-oxo-4-hydroxy-4-carboxy-5-ureidoimidazoline decarboxylase [Thermoleophilia bacterium]|nr:2-oxo-4-hydroxy-4-carboxy-5-ureidoimidazoline decarboxylase [Thermoleophilia bacterium]
MTDGTDITGTGAAANSVSDVATPTSQRSSAGGEHSPATSLRFLNNASYGSAVDMLKRCCGSSHWVREMVNTRPYSTPEDFLAAARQTDDTLTKNDWLEAFSHHPRIGDRTVLRAKVAGWANGEQRGVDAADDLLLEALAEANLEYERKFNFIFLICASGVSGREMLAAMQQRLVNDRDSEWKIAAAEQRKITQLRLNKLIEEHTQ